MYARLRTPRAASTVMLARKLALAGANCIGRSLFMGARQPQSFVLLLSLLDQTSFCLLLVDMLVTDSHARPHSGVTVIQARTWKDYPTSCFQNSSSCICSLK